MIQWADNYPPVVQIKSILKPTVPLTPPKAIPTFDETRKRSAGRSARKSPKKNSGEELLIDFSTPASSRPSTPASRCRASAAPRRPTSSRSSAAASASRSRSTASSPAASTRSTTRR
ncbi:hypothetical protein HC762_00825 [bacterium]|nr:hypothetical protein [bacterium]